MKMKFISEGTPFYCVTPPTGPLGTHSIKSLFYSCVLLAWPLIGNEAYVDLVWIETLLLCLHTHMFTYAYVYIRV